MATDTHRYATIQDLLEMEGRLRRDLGGDIHGVGADVRALENRIDEGLTGVEKELGGLRQDVKTLLNGRESVGSTPAAIPDLSELDDDAQTVYRKLVEVARNRATINYGDIGALIRRAPFALVDVLDPIFKHEHRAGRPPLSALVVSAVPDGRMPSGGFFAAARTVGMDVGHDERAFWERCRDEVYDYWAG